MCCIFAFLNAWCPTWTCEAQPFQAFTSCQEKLELELSEPNTLLWGREEASQVRNIDLKFEGNFARVQPANTLVTESHVISIPSVPVRMPGKMCPSHQRTSSPSLCQDC